MARSVEWSGGEDDQKIYGGREKRASWVRCGEWPSLRGILHTGYLVIDQTRATGRTKLLREREREREKRRRRRRREGKGDSPFHSENYPYFWRIVGSILRSIRGQILCSLFIRPWNEYFVLFYIRELISLTEFVFANQFFKSTCCNYHSNAI